MDKDTEQLTQILASVESETAAKIGEQYITYLYFSALVEFVFCTMLIAGLAYAIYRIVKDNK